VLRQLIQCPAHPPWKIKQYHKCVTGYKPSLELRVKHGGECGECLESLLINIQLHDRCAPLLLTWKPFIIKGTSIQQCQHILLGYQTPTVISPFPCHVVVSGAPPPCGALPPNEQRSLVLVGTLARAVVGSLPSRTRRILTAPDSIESGDLGPSRFVCLTQPFPTSL
jgi:hypothetical protein